MKFLILAPLFFLGFVLTGCQTPPEPLEKTPFNIVPEGFVQKAAQYLTRGKPLSRKEPLPGVPSPAKAFEKTVETFLLDPTLNPVLPKGEVKEQFPPEFLQQITIDDPILIHKFFSSDHPEKGSAWENYYYYLAAVHPTYGVAAEVLYNYLDITGYHPGEITRHYGSLEKTGDYALSQAQARQYIKESMNIRLEKDPLAVHLPGGPNKTDWDFQWYFEDPKSSPPREYLLNPFVPTNQEGKRTGSLEQAGPPKGGENALSPRVSSLKVRLNLYRRIEEEKQAVLEGESLENRPRWSLDTEVVKYGTYLPENRLPSTP